VEDLSLSNLDGLKKKSTGFNVPEVGDIGNLGVSNKQAQGQGVDVNGLLNELGNGQGKQGVDPLGGKGQGIDAAALLNELGNGHGKGQGLDAGQLLQGLGDKGGKNQHGVEIIQVKETIILNKGQNATVTQNQTVGSPLAKT
jgi:hypothetical protein